MAMQRKPGGRPGGHRAVGCGFLLATAGFACVMLLINGLLIMGLFYPLFHVVSSIAPETLREQSVRERILQGAMFVGPVLLLIIEWCIVDRFVLRADRTRQSDDGSATDF